MPETILVRSKASARHKALYKCADLNKLAGPPASLWVKP